MSHKDIDQSKEFKHNLSNISPHLLNLSNSLDFDIGSLIDEYVLTPPTILYADNESKLPIQLKHLVKDTKNKKRSSTSSLQLSVALDYLSKSFVSIHNRQLYYQKNVIKDPKYLEKFKSENDDKFPILQYFSPWFDVKTAGLSSRSLQSYERESIKTKIFEVKFMINVPIISEAISHVSLFIFDYSKNTRVTETKLYFISDLPQTISFRILQSEFSSNFALAVLFYGPYHPVSATNFISLNYYASVGIDLLMTSVSILNAKIYPINSSTLKQLTPSSNNSNEHLSIGNLDINCMPIDRTKCMSTEEVNPARPSVYLLMPSPLLRVESPSFTRRVVSDTLSQGNLFSFVSPSSGFDHLIYFFPIKVDFEAYERYLKPDGRKNIRNIAICIHCADKDDLSVESRKSILFDQTNMALTDELWTNVEYHDRMPSFLSEFQIVPPIDISEDLHLIVSFYHVSRKNIDPPILVAEGFIKLFPNSTMISDGVYEMSLYTCLNEGYLTNINFPKICQGRRIFQYGLKAFSSIYSQDSALNRIITDLGENIVQPNLIQQIKNINNADAMTKFFSVTFNLILSVIQNKCLISEQQTSFRSKRMMENPKDTDDDDELKIDLQSTPTITTSTKGLEFRDNQEVNKKVKISLSDMNIANLDQLKILFHALLELIASISYEEQISTKTFVSVVSQQVTTFVSHHLNDTTESISNIPTLFDCLSLAIAYGIRELFEINFTDWKKTFNTVRFSWVLFDCLEKLIFVGGSHSDSHEFVQLINKEVSFFNDLTKCSNIVPTSIGLVVIAYSCLFRELFERNYSFELLKVGIEPFGSMLAHLTKTIPLEVIQPVIHIVSQTLDGWRPFNERVIPNSTNDDFTDKKKRKITIPSINSKLIDENEALTVEIKHYFSSNTFNVSRNLYDLLTIFGAGISSSDEYMCLLTELHWGSQRINDVEAMKQYLLKENPILFEFLYIIALPFNNLIKFSPNASFDFDETKSTVIVALQLFRMHLTKISYDEKILQGDYISLENIFNSYFYFLFILCSNNSILRCLINVLNETKTGGFELLIIVLSLFYQSSIELPMFFIKNLRLSALSNFLKFLSKLLYFCDLNYLKDFLNKKGKIFEKQRNLENLKNFVERSFIEKTSLARVTSFARPKQIYVRNEDILEISQLLSVSMLKTVFTKVLSPLSTIRLEKGYKQLANNLLLAKKNRDNTISSISIHGLTNLMLIFDNFFLTIQELLKCQIPPKFLENLYEFLSIFACNRFKLMVFNSIHYHYEILKNSRFVITSKHILKSPLLTKLPHAYFIIEFALNGCINDNLTVRKAAAALFAEMLKTNFSKCRYLTTLAISKIFSPNYLTKDIIDKLNLSINYLISDVVWPTNKPAIKKFIGHNFKTMIDANERLSIIHSIPVDTRDNDTYFEVLYELSIQQSAVPQLRLNNLKNLLEEMINVFTVQNLSVEAAMVCFEIVLIILFQNELHDVCQMNLSSELHHLKGFYENFVKTFQKVENDENREEISSDFGLDKLFEQLLFGIEIFDRNEYYEHAIELANMCFRIFQITNYFEISKSLFEKFIKIYQKVSNLQFPEPKNGEGCRFGSFFYVSFIGKDFGMLDGKSYIYRDFPFTKFPDVVAKIEKTLPADILNKVISCGSIEGNKDINKAYLVVKEVQPLLKPIECSIKDDSNLIRANGQFIDNSSLRTFYFETKYNPTPAKGDGITRIYNRINQFTIKRPFPQPIRRIEVKSSATIKQNPATVISNSLIEKIKILEDENVNAEDRQYCLYGTLIPPVQMGIKGIFEQFFINNDQHVIEGIEELKNTLCQFFDACKIALFFDQESNFHPEFHEQLVQGFNNLIELTSEYLGYEGGKYVDFEEEEEEEDFEED
eukprot:TRINITY_DN2654_c0_g2_i2.p1 TRINITY_DN2654_c0_g2~~TRINITY_DN2654_c0_g2_i2.p1  ORF type:complete len:1869 (+),score=428.11 TRINITY_DN2654_c0_g2_i2:55-5661(+)